MELIYGMDPLCGWCFGFGPALRRVTSDHPDVTVTTVLAGLVTGSRVGPYRQMEQYIRQTSIRLQAITGRAPSQDFFDLIRQPGVIGDSMPPTVAIGAMRKVHPEHLTDFALRITDAHFVRGADLGKPQTYRDIVSEMGLDAVDFDDLDLVNVELAEAEWALGRALGLRSFPSLWIRKAGITRQTEVIYDPAQLSLAIGAHKAG